MPRGKPLSGFRITKKRQAAGWVRPDAGLVHYHNKPEPVAAAIIETEAEIDARIQERFTVLTAMTKAAVNGKAPAVVVSGPPGLGKTHEVERIIRMTDPTGDFTTSVKGYVRATGLYRTLYQFRHKHNVIVFDDADSIFSDETSLNLLKAACDTADKRIISYLTETKMKDEDDINLPKNFEFEGTIIFITNYDFDAMIEKGNKLAPHLQALISRTHYIDLMMKTRQDYIVRIKQVLKAGLLKNKGYSEDDEAEVLNFVITNQDKLRELSLRMVLKVADMMDISPSNWDKMAKATCCKR
jgi:hypothetical protein